jgi:uncharacterized membrane protein
MESVLASLVVTFVVLVIAGVIGHKLEKRPRPYGFVIPAIHIVLFLLVMAGVAASVFKLNALPDQGGLPVQISLYIVILTLWINFIVGLWMLFIKSKSRKLRKVHKISTYVMAGALLAGIAFVTAAI